MYSDWSLRKVVLFACFLQLHLLFCSGEPGQILYAFITLESTTVGPLSTRILTFVYTAACIITKRNMCMGRREKKADSVYNNNNNNRRRGFLSLVALFKVYHSQL